MSGFWHWNLIDVFNFYLGVAFLLSTYVRTNRYLSILALVRAVPGRWPRLFELVKQHGMVFLTWATVLPAILALSLLLINLVASRFIWHDANLTLAQVAGHWKAVPGLSVVGAAMFGIDLTGICWVGKFDRELLQKYFDQAEYWLRPWTAPVVRVFTLGYVNPRKMVAVEVQKALVEASRLVNTTLWWVSLQVGVRVAFGLTLWLTYAAVGS